jgi:hypothetical protein
MGDKVFSLKCKYLHMNAKETEETLIPRHYV